MASLDAEEALLKKKLEATENLDERREIRKQLRELRNRKFEEEIKKVTANDYRPGRTKTAYTNGVDGESSLSSVGRKASVEKKGEDEEDVHGINNLETEEELQALLNETPFTETEKRKKIRARIREIRNQKLGLGEPIIIRRPTREERLKEAQKEAEKENEKTNENTSDKREAIGISRDESTQGSDLLSSRSSYRSRYGKDASDATRSNEDESSKTIESSRQSRFSKKYGGDSYEDSEPSKRTDEDLGRKSNLLESNAGKCVNEMEENSGKGRTEDEKKVEDEEIQEMPDAQDEEEKAECIDEDVESDHEDAESGNEDVESDHEDVESGPEDVESYNEDVESGHEEEEAVNGYGEDRAIDRTKGQDDDLNENEEYESSVDGNVSDGKGEISDVKDLADEEDYLDYEDEAGDDRDSNNFVEDNDGDGVEKDVSDEEDFIDDEYEGVQQNEDRSYKRERGYSAEEDEYYSDDDIYEKESDPTEPVRQDRQSEGEESLDEEAYSGSEDDYEDEEELKNGISKEASRREDRGQIDYSDDYSESYSDHTATDGGSSVSGKRGDDEQDLAGYEFDRRPTERKPAGASYVSKVDEVFKQKEPALAEGKSFKELLKRSDKNTVGKVPTGKKGPEQVDFRTVLRASDKPKKFGEKSGSSVEQVDFRNLLQRKVQTKTLSEKDIGAEQVDFRTVLKAGAIPAEKKEPAARKTSNAEQLDFRNVLKKQPSIKSRKLSVDDKTEMIKSIRAGRDVPKIEGGSSSTKPSRQSIESLRESGGVGKAKEDLDKNLKGDGEGKKSSRKAGRPSLDALKQSGELGRTEDKKGLFEKGSRQKKAPATVPPRPSSKAKVNKTEPEIIEEPEFDHDDERPEIEPSKESKPRKTSVEISSKGSSEKQSRKASVEISSKGSTEKQSRKTSIEILPKVSSEQMPRKMSAEATSNVAAEKPRSRRRNDESTRSGETRSEKKLTKEIDEKRSPTKSGDKRARNRRLRQDQSEVVKTQSEDGEKERQEVDKTSEVRKKSSSIERVAVVQSTATRPTVQVILSTKSSGDKEKADDSDDESIGARRNRRRLLRKESVEEQDSGRVSVRTVKKREPETEAGKVAHASTGNSVGDEADGKPSRQVGKEDSAGALKEEQKSREAEEEDPAKARKAKTSNLDARLAERRRQRAIENRDKQQKMRNSRKAFKDKLESNAPTTNGSASPSIQRANSNMTKLLHWCQRMTDGYPNVSVTNFTTSWKDGLAFCALLHNFCAEKIPFNELTAKRPRENFEIAFTAASDEGVPELLEADDMVRMECPDPKSVITYIHSIYQVFVADRR